VALRPEPRSSPTHLERTPSSDSAPRSDAADRERGGAASNPGARRRRRRRRSAAQDPARADDALRRAGPFDAEGPGEGDDELPEGGAFEDGALEDDTWSTPRRPRREGPRPVEVSAERIPREHIDQDALRVVSRLTRRGFEAYLVGGCVRDLLLGLTPKDFDVATEAHPRQIKRVFRNGRIIGRRFKLVHVVYGDHVIETSTFRAEPPSRDEGDDEDLLIVDDNQFGTAAEDARRRDFTINALFLDPLEHRILDYVGGLEDLGRRCLRTIGDPRVRMAEDPVRILRAAKFATRLDFSIDPATFEAMCAAAPELERSAPARLVEEILKLLRSGYAGPSFRLLHRCGALAVLLPGVAEWLEGAAQGRGDPNDLWHLLDAFDQRTRRGSEPTIALGLAVLFAPLADQRLAELGDDPPPTEGEVQGALDGLLESIGAPSRISRRDVSLARRMLANQRRFRQASSKRFRPLLFMRSPDFAPTLELFHLRVEARNEDWELLETWQQRYRSALEVDEAEVAQMRTSRRRKRRRKRN
jgi:poly(A) polymerase